MSNYTKATNFATKDTLPTGDANKIVKGTEIDNEFNALSGAISSKADIASPTFTGTPAAPTATSGSNTTQLASTAFVTGAITDTVTSTTTFTNKTINLTSNTLVGTTAQFNSALSDNDFATLAGTETLTNKTLTSPTINTPSIASPTMTGTPVAPTAAAATNTTQVATTAHVFAERTNTATLTNKTLTSPSINSATISGGSISGITDLAVADGGTGASTLAANNVLLGNGTSALQTVAPSTTGNILTSNGTTWTSAAPPLTSVNGGTGAVTINRGMEFFLTTTNWTAPAGVVRVKIYAVGGSQGGSNLPAGGTAGIVSLGVYAPGGAQNQNPVGIGGTFNFNIGLPQGIPFRLYTGASGCCGAIYYGQGNGGLVIGYATVVPGTTYSVTAGASFSGVAQGFCLLEW